MICFSNFVGFTSIGASSEACDNYKNGRVVDTLWYHNMQRGVSILPIQSLALDRWVTFVSLPPNLNPLFSAIGVDLDSHTDQNIIHILLEANIYPDLAAIENGADVVLVSSYLVVIQLAVLRSFLFLLYSLRTNQLFVRLQAEKFGMPIAWKIDTNLAIILKSNVTLFTELIRDSFIQNTLFINNYLPIIRIESK